jgi:nucleoside-diphosphate-sugar epimerase
MTYLIALTGRNFTFDQVHVEGARRIARLAREAGVERFIQMSALNVEENPKRLVSWRGSQFLASKVKKIHEIKFVFSIFFWTLQSLFYRVVER